MRLGIRRSNFGLISSVVYALVILMQFLLDRFAGFDPRGDLLGWWGFSFDLMSVIYMSLQMEAIVRRVENDSRDVARDNLFSIFPLFALVVGSLFKGLDYFYTTTWPKGGFGMNEWIAWWQHLAGFWTALEWRIFVIAVIAVLVDIVQYSNATNRITAAARSESRTAG